MRKPPATATPFTFRWRASPRLYGVAVVQQAVDQRGRHYLVAEHPAPVLEALVGRQDRRSPFVTRVALRAPGRGWLQDR